MGELTGLRISLEARTPGAGEEGGCSPGSCQHRRPEPGLTGRRVRALCPGGSWGSARCPLSCAPAADHARHARHCSPCGAHFHEIKTVSSQQTHGQKLNHYRLQVMKSVS